MASDQQIDILNAHRGNHPSPYDSAAFGRVGNDVSGQGFYRGLDADEALQVDDAGTYIYVGTAIPGTATSAASWKIKRIVAATGVTTYADGDAFYNNIWDNRASLTYS